MVTIIIPYRRSCKDRERNLEFLISNISALRIPCIVAEQVDEWELDPKSSVSPEGVQRLYLKNDGLFQKSKLINMAVDNCDSKYVWLLDVDVYLDFQRIVKEIKNQDVIKPFSEIYHYCLEKTELYTRGKEEYKNINHLSSSDYYGKYSIILKKEIFHSVGGFDERFEGWGWEDLDFIHNKINKLDLNVHTVEINGVHLYHEEAPRTNERRNYFLYKKNFNGSNKKLSFCIHIKNRLDQLKETLRKNIEDNRGNEEDIEFVLVDFGSSDFVSEWVISNFKPELKTGFLKLFKIFDFPFWHASVAKNTSHYHAEGDILVNLDCDNFTGKEGGKLLIDTFVDEEVVSVHQFCESDWEDGSYGRISIRREEFHKLGGYDESFHNMGYQDTDMIKRIRHSNQSGVIVNTDTKYNKAIRNKKERSMENLPPSLKKKGYSWINSENEKKSKKNIEENKTVANGEFYGIREGVKYYDLKRNRFKGFNS